MTLDEYQRDAGLTRVYRRNDMNILYPILGLCGESGEVAEAMKKAMRDRGATHDVASLSPEDRNHILLELGDVLWYVAEIASVLDEDLSTIAGMNLAKLVSRAQRGVVGGDGDDR